MKLFKKLSALSLAMVLVLALFACGGGAGSAAPAEAGSTQAPQSTAPEAEPAADEEPVLVVYSSRSEQLNNAVIPAFEKATGIKVEVVVAGTGEVLKRVESEKNNPQGDIFWASDESTLSDYKELFMPYVSPEDEFMQESSRNKEGYFTPAFADPIVFIVNTDLAGDMKIESFEDLLNPELKGKIAMGDPINSNSAFVNLVGMLYAFGEDGDPLADSSWEYVDAFIKNLDGKICNSSSQVYKGVADGEYVVGLTWEDPAVNLAISGAPVKVVFPAEGSIFPGESVQIIAGCSHPENAKKFVDFMISDEIQTWVGQNLTVRPLRVGVELADYMTPVEDINVVEDFDEGWVAANKSKIVELYSEHLENSL